MLGRLHTNNRKPQWNRFVSCAALGLCLFALVAMPALDQHIFHHSAVTYSEHSSDSENTCPICQFVRLVTPYFVDIELVPLPTDIVVETCLTVSIPSVAYATALPPCRAPPVV